MRSGVALVACGILAACSSGVSGTDTTPAPVHTVTATVTGAPWTMTNVRATYISASGTFLLTAIDSLHSPASEITFYLDAAHAATVYTPQNNPAMIVDFTRRDSTWNTLLGKIGSVTFTTLSATRVAGTFDVRVHPDPSLNAADSAAVIALVGKFDVGIP